MFGNVKIKQLANLLRIFTIKENVSPISSKEIKVFEFFSDTGSSQVLLLLMVPSSLDGLSSYNHSYPYSVYRPLL